MSARNATTGPSELPRNEPQYSGATETVHVLDAELVEKGLYASRRAVFLETELWDADGNPAGSHSSREGSRAPRTEDPRVIVKAWPAAPWEPVMAGSVPRQKRHLSCLYLCSCCLVSTGLRQSAPNGLNSIIEAPPFGSDFALGETCWLPDSDSTVGLQPGTPADARWAPTPQGPSSTSPTYYLRNGMICGMTGYNLRKALMLSERHTRDSTS